MLLGCGSRVHRILRLGDIAASFPPVALSSSGFGRIELLLHNRAWGEGCYFLGGLGDLFAGWKGDNSGSLVFYSEDTEAAEFHSRIVDKAVDHFIEESLNDLSGEIEGKVMLLGDLSHQVGLDHG